MLHKTTLEGTQTRMQAAKGRARYRGGYSKPYPYNKGGEAQYQQP